jgi:hypothetical protein
MDPQELSKEQLQELDDALKRGAAFEELVKQKGWELLKAQYENRVRAFVNGMLLKPELPITSFEGERQQLIGMKSFLGSIQVDLKTLTDFRKKDEKRSTE